MRLLRLIIALVVVATSASLHEVNAQSVYNSNNSTVGYVRSDGRVENNNHSCIGYIRNDGRVENSNHSCIGRVDGVTREWAAAFFFFFFN